MGTTNNTGATTGDPREEIPVIGGQVAAKITSPDDQPPVLSPH